MKDISEQASRNGVDLKEHGACQFCGASMTRGVRECFELSNGVVQILDLGIVSHRMARFLSVDAHALQHPEIHGRWSNHFHLVRLRLILEHGLQWDYADSTRLSAMLNEGKTDLEHNWLLPPSDRGTLTTERLRNIGDAEDLVRRIQQWAQEVHRAWASSHEALNGVIVEFLRTNQDHG